MNNFNNENSSGEGAKNKSEELRKHARQIELKIYNLQSELVNLRKQLAGKEINDYILRTVEGNHALSDFLGTKDTLILIHNMGGNCPHCTAYADGLNGVLNHLQSFAAVLLVSPDEPELQTKIAELRGWHFQLASVKESSLSQDLGFEPTPKNYYPGICIIKKRPNGKLELINKDDFEPSDRYSPIWHVIALMNGNYNDWEPQNSYI